MSCLPDCKTDLAAQPVRHPRTSTPEGWDEGRAGPASPAGVPMSDVTLLLSAIEQGDPRAAE
jgi:hypothetical protein